MSEQVLGLKPLTDDGDDRPPIPLRVHSTLGRNPKTPTPGHVDLGLTKDNACHVSRNACEIKSITATQLTLTVPPDTLDLYQKGKQYKLRYRRRGSSAETKELDSDRLVLKPGDVLIFYAKPRPHSFEVVQLARLPSKAATATAQQQTTITSSSFRKQSPHKVASSSLPKRKFTATTAAAEIVPAPRKKICSATNKTFLTTGENPFNFPWTIANDLNNESVAQQVQKQRDHDDDPSWRALEILPANKSTTTTSRTTNDDQFEHDSDDDDDDDTPLFFRVRDMHVTHANTFLKALHSDTPSAFKTLLQLLLSNRRLPTLKLCEELVRRLTLGCSGGTTLEDVAPKKQKGNPEPVWDENRLELAYHYVESVLQQHPEVAYDRFAEAAGSDYWRNVLEELCKLPYAVGTEETTRMGVKHSLLLHVCAMKLLYRLLNGLIHRTGTASPLIRDLNEYGGKAACKVAANAMAHIWVEFGQYLCNDEIDDADNDSADLMAVTLDLTSLLGKTMVLLLRKFVVMDMDSKQARNSSSNMKEAVDILWNALDQRMQRPSNTSNWSSKSNGKNNILHLKLRWIESLDWPDLEDALAKRLRISKEYNDIEAAVTRK